MKLYELNTNRGLLGLNTDLRFKIGKANIMGNETYIRANYNCAVDAIQIFVSQTRDGCKMAGEMRYKKIPELCYQPVAIQLQPEELQRLMNDLWQLGIRPAGEGHTGQIAAIKEHLNDMKKIAAKFLKVKF